MVVYNHLLGNILGVQVKWDNSQILILNVYVPNIAKARKKLWKDPTTKSQIEGEWCIMGDFNKVEKSPIDVAHLSFCQDPRRTAGGSYPLNGRSKTSRKEMIEKK